MLHCPRCRYEYEDGTPRCSDCGGVLALGPLPEAARQELGKAPLVGVFTPEDEFGGRMIADLLTENGIPATISSQEMPWYDGLSSHAMNPGRWGLVLVRRPDAARARQLIEDYLTAAESADGSERVSG